MRNFIRALDWLGRANDGSWIIAKLSSLSIGGGMIGGWALQTLYGGLIGALIGAVTFMMLWGFRAVLEVVFPKPSLEVEPDYEIKPDGREPEFGYGRSINGHLQSAYVSLNVRPIGGHWPERITNIYVELYQKRLGAIARTVSTLPFNIPDTIDWQISRDSSFTETNIVFHKTDLNWQSSPKIPVGEELNVRVVAELGNNTRRTITSNVPMKIHVHDPYHQ